jgi:hypothetical protein
MATGNPAIFPLVYGRDADVVPVHLTKPIGPMFRPIACDR